MDREQNILRHILEADLIPKNYDDLKEQYIKTVNHLITALDERDEYQGKLHYAKNKKQGYTENDMYKAFGFGQSNNNREDFKEFLNQLKQ